MLKIYRVVSEFKIDDGEWQRCGFDGWCCKEESKVSPIVVVEDSVDFDTMNAHIDEDRNMFVEMYTGCTMLRKRKYICVRGFFSFEVRYFKGDFNTMSYRLVYKEDNDVTMKWIMQHLSADKAMQYFKERGLTVCPIA